MKEIPMLFSTDMADANMQGLKSQTRRIVKIKHRINGGEGFPGEADQVPDMWAPVQKDKALWNTTEGGVYLGPEDENDFNCYVDFESKEIDGSTWMALAKCPYGQPGDIIWQREIFAQCFFEDKMKDGREGHNYIYKANPGDKDILDSFEIPRWRPSIHMPKAACRLWLKITGIAVHRLHNISTEDILREGVKYPVTTSRRFPGKANPVFKLGEDNSAISFMPDGWQQMEDESLHKALLFAHWAELWCKVNGRKSWDSNPWVWVISFQKIEKQ